MERNKKMFKIKMFNEVLLHVVKEEKEERKKYENIKKGFFPSGKQKQQAHVDINAK